MCYFFKIRPPPISTLFPYTTLFRSALPVADRRAAVPLPHHRRQHRLELPPDVLGQSAGELLQLHREGLLAGWHGPVRSEEHTSELQSRRDLVCRLLLEKKKDDKTIA